MKKLIASFVLFLGFVLSVNAFAAEFADWDEQDSSTLDSNEDAADFEGIGTGGAYANS